MPPMPLFLLLVHTYAHECNVIDCRPAGSAPPRSGAAAAITQSPVTPTPTHMLKWNLAASACLYLRLFLDDRVCLGIQLLQVGILGSGRRLWRHFLRVGEVLLRLYIALRCLDCRCRIHVGVGCVGLNARFWHAQTLQTGTRRPC